MNITPEIFAELYEIHDKVKVLLEKESDLYKKYTEGSTERNHEVERGSEKVTVTEAELWEGARYGSEEALSILRPLHSDLFEIAGEREKANVILRDFLKLNFDFDPQEFNPVKMIDIMRGIAQYEISKADMKNDKN